MAESAVTLAIVTALAGLALGAVIALVLAGRRSSSELTGRMSQMAESQAAVQARLAEQFQAQERAVTKAL